MKVRLIRKPKSGPPVYEILFKYKDQAAQKLIRFRRRFALSRKEAETLGHALKYAAGQGRIGEVLDALANEADGAPQEMEVVIDKSATPVAEFLWEWFRLYAPDNKPAEQTNKREVIALHLVPFLGDHEVGKVTAETVERFKRWMQARPNGRGGTYAPRTVNKCLSVLKTAYNSAVKWGYVDVNPVRDVRLVAVREAEEDFENYMDEKEVRLYLAAMSERYPKWYPHILLLVSTGMRVGESFALEKRDINWEQRTVCIRRNIDAKGNILSPKGGRARTIPLSGEVLQTLRAHCKANLESTIVFPNRRGSHFRDRNSLLRPHEQALKLAGITKHVTPHGLRHTAGTLLASQGANEETIRRFMGHASTAVLQRYMHLGKAHDRQTADILADALGLRSPTRLLRGQRSLISLAPNGDE